MLNLKKMTNFICESPYSVRIQDNTDQKKNHVWTLSRSVSAEVQIMGI